MTLFGKVVPYSFHVFQKVTVLGSFPAQESGNFRVFTVGKHGNYRFEPETKGTRPSLVRHRGTGIPLSAPQAVPGIPLQPGLLAKGW